MERISLTVDEKLEALALKYYQDYQWIPKAGDYYTTSRNDLELYLVVDVTDEHIYTRYCDPQKGNKVSQWKKTEFLTDFGLKRVYVADWILNR